MGEQLQAWLDLGAQTLPGIHLSPFLTFAFLCVGFIIRQILKLLTKMAACSSKLNSHQFGI